MMDFAPHPPACGRDGNDPVDPRDAQIYFDMTQQATLLSLRPFQPVAISLARESLFYISPPRGAVFREKGETRRYNDVSSFQSPCRYCTPKQRFQNHAMDFVLRLLRDIGFLGWSCWVLFGSGSIGVYGV